MFVHGSRAILRRIDELDFLAERAPDCASKQRIMRAAKHKCIDPVRHHWIEITPDRLIRQAVVKQSFFDQRHEQRTSAGS